MNMRRHGESPVESSRALDLATAPLLRVTLDIREVNQDIVRLGCYLTVCQKTCWRSITLMRCRGCSYPNCLVDDDVHGGGVCERVSLDLLLGERVLHLLRSLAMEVPQFSYIRDMTAATVVWC